MIVFGNNVRVQYELNQERKARAAAHRRWVFAIVLCSLAWGGACYLDSVNEETGAALIVGEFCPVSGGDLSKGGR